jgi:hypothetical protein
MESSNRQFLQDQIDEIEAMNFPTEEEKLERMHPYWRNNLGIKGESSWNDCAPVGPVRQSREERNVSRLADVKTLYHQYMDGIQPPTLVSEKWCQMYLETVQSMCNEAAFRDEEDEEFEVPLCRELGSFVKYADVSRIQTSGAQASPLSDRFLQQRQRTIPLGITRRCLHCRPLILARPEKR